MPATRVRHTLSSSTSRTCTSEGEELAIAFAPYATSLDVWESNRRLSHERRRLTRRRRRRPHALRTRLHLAGCLSRVRRRSRRSDLNACSCGPPRPRTFGVCRALVVSARTHKTAEVSQGPFCHSEQTTWHSQLLGLRFPVSRLCAVVVSVLLERGVFRVYFNSFSKNSPVAWDNPQTIL